MDYRFADLFDDVRSNELYKSIVTKSELDDDYQSAVMYLRCAPENLGSDKKLSDIPLGSDYHNKLFLTDLLAMSDEDIVIDNGISTIIYIGTEKKGNRLLNFYEENSIKNYFYELKDRPDSNIYDILDDTYEKISNGLDDGNVAVHCVAGISRSASILLYFLLKSKLMLTLLDAVKYLKKHRREVDPNDGFLLQVYLKNKLCNSK